MGIYMSYGSIKGDATQQGFEHWINVLKFDWPDAVKRDITTQTGRARNREHGQPKIGQDQDHQGSRSRKRSAVQGIGRGSQSGDMQDRFCPYR